MAQKRFFLFTISIAFLLTSCTASDKESLHEFNKYAKLLMPNNTIQILLDSIYLSIYGNAPDNKSQL